MGICGTVATAVACVWGLVHYTRTSPRFAIRSIVVTGASHLEGGAVGAAAGIAPGQNIFLTDLEMARSRLVESPWIESATITRTLPATVRIDVVEREASALVTIGEDIYLATRSGDIFKKLEPLDPYDLPVITGIQLSDVARDRAAVTGSVHRAIDLLGEYERSALQKNFPEQEAHIADDGSLDLTVGKSSTVLRMGRGPYRQPIEQASRVLNEVASRRAEAEVVFLDNEAHPERVVVRMR